MKTPPLATSSPNGTPQDIAGILNVGSTSVLFGNRAVDDEGSGGGRFTLGFCLDACLLSSLDIRYLFLGDEDEHFSAGQSNGSILARPFFNTQTGQQDARLIVFPDLVQGALAIETETMFQTAEVLYRRRFHDCAVRRDYYVGYRYAELEDLVGISESTLSLSGPTQGSTFELFDRFETRNSVHGAELGVKCLGPARGCWSLDMSANVALGTTQMRATVAGQTTATTPTGETTTTDAGLLAQATNSGTFEDDQFSTLTEFGIMLRRQSACGWALTFGYNLVYWSDVFRAGEQIDLDINTSQIPPGTLQGTPRPRFLFESTDFWAQGLQFGFEYLF
jgi:hypothetical protein